MIRLLIAAAALFAAGGMAWAQGASPPSGARIVMENDRIRILEITLRPRSKVNVETPAERERFLYMLSDGALVLSPPGRKPYEFALQSGEAVLFPAVSPTVENDTDGTVKALLVELKPASAGPIRSAKAKRAAKGKKAAVKGAKKAKAAKAKKKK
jgi:redox-sensitive bicupin YhaK (pirin superfamily)